MFQHFFIGPWWPSQTVDVVWCVEFTEHVGRNYMQNYYTAFHKAALIFVTHSNWVSRNMRVNFHNLINFLITLPPLPYNCKSFCLAWIILIICPIKTKYEGWLASRGGTR